METNKLKKRNQNSPLVFGVFLVIIGIVVLVLNFGAKGANLTPIIFSWQMLVFIIGLLSAINRKYLFGVFLIILAIFFAIPPLSNVFPDTFLWVKPDFLKTYWALLLVVAGIFIVISRLYCRNNSHCGGKFSSHNYSRNVSSGTSDGFIQREVVFSGVDEIFNEPIFTGAKLKCTFGGVEIDLRQAALPEGDTVVNMKCTFGGVVLHVPESWYVEFHTNCVFGGATDSRIKNGTDKTHRLIIAGECVFGGCEIQ